jgi:hypothetical protein
MGAPIVVNTVKVQGTVTSNAGSGTLAVSAAAAAPVYIIGTATATNASTGALFVQGTTTVTVPATGAAYVQGTVTASNVAAGALFVQGTVTVPNTAPAYIAGTTTVTNAAAGAIYAQGTVSISGTANTVERGTTISQGSVFLGTAMGTVLTSSATRRTILIQNLGTDYVWLGGSTAIVVNTGARLAPGQAITIDKSPVSAIYAVASSGSQTVCYFTESD